MVDGISGVVIAGLESDGFEVEAEGDAGVFSVIGRDDLAYRRPVQLIVHESDISEYCSCMVRDGSYPSSVEEAAGLAALHVQEMLGAGHDRNRNTVRRTGFRRTGGTVELFVDSEPVEIESDQSLGVNTWVAERPERT